MGVGIFCWGGGFKGEKREEGKSERRGKGITSNLAKTHNGHHHKP